MPNLYVRRIDDQEIVDTVEVKESNLFQLDRIMRGMLRQMDMDRFYIDDSECE